MDSALERAQQEPKQEATVSQHKSSRSHGQRERKRDPLLFELLDFIRVLRRDMAYI